MAKKTFEVGQRVATWMDEDEEFTAKGRYDEYGDSGPHYGKVVAVEGTQVRVKFDDEYLNDENAEGVRSDTLLGAKVLVTEAEAKTAVNDLEKEFKSVEKQIEKELKNAAASIRAANKLAKKLGTNLSDMGAGYGSLYGAMDDAGWQTSSFGC